MATCTDVFALLRLDISYYQNISYMSDTEHLLDHSFTHYCTKKLSFEKNMGKGDRKRRKSFFKKGHKLCPRKGLKTSSDKKDKIVECESVCYIRLTAEEQSLVQDNPILPAARQQDHTSHTQGPEIRLLRHKNMKASTDRKCSSEAAIQRAETDSYRLLHCKKLWEMVNEVTKDHLIRNKRCTGDLNFDFNREQQRGLCWRECVICNKCQYRSKMYSLYKEIETGRRGRKSADANIGMSIAMTQTPIGVTGVRKLLLGSNTPAPTMKGMQKTATKVSNIIESANKEDMKQRRGQLKLVNKIRGLPENEVAIQADGMYNNSLWSGVTRTPYQPATQMAYVVAENVTGQHQIINVELVNKLCSKHGYHSQESEKCDIKCDPCSSTTSIETSIGDEKRWAKLCLTGLLEDGLNVKYITTDQDTAAHLAATELYEEKMSEVEPIYQVDTRHLSASHRKQMKSSTEVLAMMPGKTKQYRQYIQNRFSTDLAKRCNAEYSAIFKNEAGNFSAISHKIGQAINAIKRCYSADHSRCKSYSAVCHGEKDNNWILRSAYLNKNFKIDLNNQNNEEILLRCIEYRLGSDVLQKTRLNTNSQKVEATNRSLRKSLPKNCTFGRNFPGRAHSAIHSVNNGPGESIRKLCEKAGCTFTSGSRVSSGLILEQHQSEIKKQRAKLIVNKAKRIQKATKLYRLYEKDHERNRYIRSQLARKLKSARKPSNVSAVPPESLKYCKTTLREHAYTRDPSLTKRRGRLGSVNQHSVPKVDTELAHSSSHGVQV